MAQALLESRLQEPGRYRVDSAGIGALVDAPAHPIAVELMNERGLDISGHRARQLDLELGRAFDVILVMEQGHKRWIERRMPELRGRVYTLGHWSETTVPDPYRKPRAQFERALELVEQGVDEWISRIT